MIAVVLVILLDFVLTILVIIVEAKRNENSKFNHRVSLSSILYLNAMMLSSIKASEEENERGGGSGREIDRERERE